MRRAGGHHCPGGYRAPYSRCATARTGIVSRVTPPVVRSRCHHVCRNYLAIRAWRVHQIAGESLSSRRRFRSRQRPRLDTAQWWRRVAMQNSPVERVTVA